MYKWRGSEDSTPNDGLIYSKPPPLEVTLHPVSALIYIKLTPPTPNIRSRRLNPSGGFSIPIHTFS